MSRLHRAAAVQAELAADDEARAQVAAAWEVGRLRWKLSEYQHVVYDTIWGLIERLRGKEPEENDYRAATIVASRKIGKSYIETVIGHEFCVRYPKSIVYITAPTEKEAREIFLPEFEKVQQDCPIHLRPVKQGVDHHWVFPNGSRIVLKGVDLAPNRVRGPSSDLNFVDEAAYVRALKYLINSVLYPMTINTGGVTIMNSTLNKAPDNEFNDFFDKCEPMGQAAVIDVYSAGFSAKQIAAEKNAVDQITWEVEYECRRKRDANLTAVPEWTDNVPAMLTAEPPTEADYGDDPALAHWARFSAADFGTVDNTVVLASYYDFRAATLWVTDERVLNGAAVHSAGVHQAFADAERDADAARPMAPTATRTRLGDNDITLLQSVQVNHGMAIQGIHKISLEGMMNLTRTYVREARLRISPRCVNLLACLKHASWKAASSGKGDGSFTRVLARSALADSEGRPLGHYDALMALVYLILTVDRAKGINPLPQTYVTPAQVQRFGAYSQDRYFQAKPPKDRYTKTETGRTVRVPQAPGWLKRPGQK